MANQALPLRPEHSNRRSFTLLCFMVRCNAILLLYKGLLPPTSMRAFCFRTIKFHDVKQQVLHTWE